MHKKSSELDQQVQALTPREVAMLTLFNELDEDAQREIQAAAEEKKRLTEEKKRLAELEKRISRLEAYGPDGQKMA